MRFPLQATRRKDDLVSRLCSFESAMVRLIRQLECIGFALKKMPQFQEKLEAKCCCQGIMSCQCRVVCVFRMLNERASEKSMAEAHPSPSQKKLLCILLFVGVCRFFVVVVVVKVLFFCRGLKVFLSLSGLCFLVVTSTRSPNPESGCSTVKKSCLHSRMDLNETK